jgi:hypothetical protein
MSEDHTIFFDGRTLSLQEVLLVSEQRAKVGVSDDAWPRIDAARSVVDRIVTTGETVLKTSKSTLFGRMPRLWASLWPSKKSEQ